MAFIDDEHQRLLVLGDLRAREQELVSERDRLAEKNDQARERVEDMIGRLKRLEDEA